MQLKEGIDLFLAGQPKESTRRKYASILESFARSCDVRGIQCLAEVATADVIGFKAEQARHAPATRTLRLATVRSFLNTAAAAGWIATSPAAHLRLETPTKRRRQSSLTLDEQLDLIAAAAPGRDRVLLTLLLSTGARIGELCRAQVRDFDDRTLRLIGKGDRERFVPLASAVADQLTSYLASRGRLRPTASLLGGRKGGLSTSQGWRIFSSTCSRAGLERMGPHQARHAAANRWVVDQVPIMVVSALLGHSRVSTTVDFYLHATEAQMAQAIDSDRLLAAIA